jgi:NAD(P)-dependent dehydrogenase (short-subunit alcohol dehydrogenase family)
LTPFAVEADGRKCPLPTCNNEAEAAFSREKLLAAIPLGPLGSPAETAQAAVFLASDASSFVTGIDLRVDGGVGQI